MADEPNTKHAALNVDVRNAILESIKASVEKEKGVNLRNVGSIAGALDRLAARDLYNKGPVGDNYSKNTQRQAFGEDRILTLEELKEVGELARRT